MIPTDKSPAALLQLGYLFPVGEHGSQYLVVMRIVERTQVDDAGIYGSIDELPILCLITTDHYLSLTHALQGPHGRSETVELIDHYIGLGNKLLILFERHRLNLTKRDRIGILLGQTVEQGLQLVGALHLSALFMDSEEYAELG